MSPGGGPDTLPLDREGAITQVHRIVNTRTVQLAMRHPAQPKSGARSSQAAISTESLPSWVAAAQEPAHLTQFRHYILGPLIGKGGMGKVFLAFDPALRREIALKLVRGDNPELLERMLREARAQSRIDHPNVCRVFEAGVEGGQTFIAMQFIRGRTLGDIAFEVPIEERVRLLRVVCEALHEAHRQGLVHRDIKPGNIMVEVQKDGSLKPYLMDFGLVRDASEPGMTATGFVMGTPVYMAPEQARGDLLALDRRADVYSLGATLYFLLCGSPPFEGSDIEVVIHVIHDEPEPLRQRQSSIPPDLETVAHRCLEKEPSRRYDSARALGEDLQRFLEGEPILARKPTLDYRIRKWIQKNRSLAILGVVSALVTLVLAGYGLLTSIKGRRQAQYASYFSLEAERAEAAIRMAGLLPLHDPAPERVVVEQRMEHLLATMAREGSWSEAPGRFAIGRGYLALGEPQRAQVELEASWKGGFQGPEVSQSLGLAYAELYQAGVREAMEDSDARSRSARLDALNRTLLWRAQFHLRRAKALENDRTLYAEALLDFVEGREPEALEKAHRLGLMGPWHYEGPLLIGQVHRIRSIRADENDRLQDSRWSLDRAREAFDAAHRIAPSSPQVMEGLLWAARQELNLRFQEQEKLTPKDLAASEEILHRSEHLGTSWAPLLNERATLVMRRADLSIVVMRDSIPGYDEAIRLLRLSIRMDPAPETLGLLGKVWAIKSEYLADKNSDPDTACREAMEAFKLLSAQQPLTFRNLYYLAIAQLSRGQYRLTQGKDGAAAALGQAAETMDRALAARRTVQFLQMRGWIGSTFGEAILLSGGDPRPEWNRAALFNQEAIAMDPKNEAIFRNQTDLLLDLVSAQRAAGQRPSPDLLQGLEPNALTLSSSIGFGEIYRERWELLRYMIGIPEASIPNGHLKSVPQELKIFHGLTRLQIALERLRAAPQGSSMNGVAMRQIESLVKSEPSHPPTWRYRSRLEEARGLMGKQPVVRNNGPPTAGSRLAPRPDRKAETIPQ